MRSRVKDPRIDAYIAQAAPFARPILTHLRSVVHAAWPTIEETIKWSFPHFTHRGIVCSMAAFKEHAVFGFWKGALIIGPGGKSIAAMGSFGRITSIDDLPSKRTLIGQSAKPPSSTRAAPKSLAREYIEWITEAKRPETRATRLATTVKWLGERKIRNWRYA